MEYLWYGIAGVLSGVLGGMGMGGGTLLIPLLSLFYSVGQHTSQAVNLISFIPMAIVALIIIFRIKAKKKGVSSCGCNCAGCSGRTICHSHGNTTPKEIKKEKVEK